MRVAGLVLVVLGALALWHGGVNAASREAVAGDGPAEARTDRGKPVGVPPVVGGIAVVSGLIVLAAVPPPGRRRD